MATRLVLEDFLETPENAEFENAVIPAEGKGVELYENGYKAGWDDAVNADHNVRQRVGADLEKTLHDLSFTFHEARTEMVNAIAPLLQTIGQQLLPELAQQGFADQVLDLVRQRAEGLRVELQVSHQNVEAVRNLFEDADDADASIRGTHDLGPGQAVIRIGSSEEMMDQQALLDDIRAGLDAITAAPAPPNSEENTDGLSAQHAG